MSQGREPFSSQEELQRQAQRWRREGEEDARAGLTPRHDPFCTCYPWYKEGYDSVKEAP